MALEPVTGKVDFSRLSVRIDLDQHERVIDGPRFAQRLDARQPEGVPPADAKVVEVAGVNHRSASAAEPLPKLISIAAQYGDETLNCDTRLWLVRLCLKAFPDFSQRRRSCRNNVSRPVGIVFSSTRTCVLISWIAPI